MSPDENDTSAEPDEPEPSRSEVEVGLQLHESLETRAALDVAGLVEKTLDALRLLGCLRGELSIVIVGDEVMRDRHRRCLGIDTTTDVLTFDFADESARSDAIDAEIFVCLDEAARQARARSHAVERELLLYIIHGILHCLGHDDQDAAQYERMHQREDEILARLGVGATFQRGTAQDRQGPQGEGRSMEDERDR